MPFRHRLFRFCKTRTAKTIIAATVTENPPFLVGKILLAMPGIGDPRFDRAAIAMCAHDENGALGLDIGKIVPRVRLHDLLGQFDIEPGLAPNCLVHAGGPVEQQRGFVLHSLDWGGDGTIQVADRWGLTGTIDALRAIAEGRGPTRWLVALGYAGWGEGQLEGELARPGWHVAESDDGLIFGTKPSERWVAAFEASGIDPRMLSPSGGHA
jgi:putative transcriptional regulator